MYQNKFRQVLWLFHGKLDYSGSNTMVLTQEYLNHQNEGLRHLMLRKITKKLTHKPRL